MQKIDFNHFYIETAGRIAEKYQIFINPNIQTFFKCGDVYFALTAYGDTVYVNMMVGTAENNIDGLRIFMKEIKKSFKFLKMGTVEHDRSIVLYRYLGAKFLKKELNYYKDGSSYVEFELDLKNCKRV